jgi:hypothetical protein
MPELTTFISTRTAAGTCYSGPIVRAEQTTGETFSSLLAAGRRLHCLTHDQAFTACAIVTHGAGCTSAMSNALLYLATCFQTHAAPGARFTCRRHQGAVCWGYFPYP